MKVVSMKLICLVITSTVFLYTSAFSQDNITETEKPGRVADTSPPDTLSEKRETASEDSSVQPDTLGENEKQPGDNKPDSTIDAVAVSKEETDTKESFDDFESDKFKLDLILDISRGMSITQFTVKSPDYIATEPKADFLFDIGLMLPFKKWFFTSVSFRYMKLKFSLSEELISSLGQTTMSMTTGTEESMNFISAPIKFGMRFDMGVIIPYFYADMEAAYLTACSQFSVRDVHAIFPDSSEYLLSNDVKDINTTDYRERHQIFIGGGIGLEISYGYGYIYLDGGCQVALFETDEPNDVKSLPLRTSSRIIYFPISLGIRFYL